MAIMHEPKLIKIEWRPDWGCATLTYTVDVPMNKNLLVIADKARQRIIKKVFKEIERGKKNDN